jgi:hypothetical protein
VRRSRSASAWSTGPRNSALDLTRPKSLRNHSRGPWRDGRRPRRHPFVRGRRLVVGRPGGLACFVAKACRDEQENRRPVALPGGTSRRSRRRRERPDPYAKPNRGERSLTQKKPQTDGRRGAGRLCLAPPGQSHPHRECPWATGRAVLPPAEFSPPRSA